jgi:hypothetical protein
MRSRWLRGKISERALSVCLFFGFFFFAHHAFASQASLVEALKLPSFGGGPVQVRLYTDYFCGPCSRTEPKIEQLLLDLVKKKAVTLIFVDTPVHAGTPLYAKYFLYILNSKRTLEHALQSRAALFEAAKNKIEEADKLEEFLRAKGIRFQVMEHSAVFAAFSSLINEDAIKSTPTCVVIKDGKKSLHNGEIEIVNALQQLK